MNTLIKTLMPSMLLYGAYQSATYKDLTTNHSPSNTLLLAKLQPFLNQIGIRKDLKIKERVSIGLAEAFGTNSFKSGDAVIHTAPGMYEIDPQASSFILKHEISHIKDNDHVQACTLALVSTLAALQLTSSYDESISADVTATTGAISLFSCKVLQEVKADDFAIENSSIDELKGGRRIFKAMQQLYLEAREEKMWKKLLISPAGENLLDILHPSLASRIKKIEHKLQAKNAIIHEDREQEKIEKLKQLIQDMNPKILENLRSARNKI